MASRACAEAACAALLSDGACVCGAQDALLCLTPSAQRLSDAFRPAHRSPWRDVHGTPPRPETSCELLRAANDALADVCAPRQAPPDSPPLPSRGSVGGGFRLDSLAARPPSAVEETPWPRPHNRQQQPDWRQQPPKQQPLRQQNNWAAEEAEAEADEAVPQGGFVSARARLGIPKRQPRDAAAEPVERPRRALGLSKRRRVFKPPGRIDEPPAAAGGGGGGGGGGFRADRAIKRAAGAPQGEEGGLPPEYENEARLRGLDQALIERVESEVLQKGDPVSFDDIAGLQFAKDNIEEIVVWPLKNPEYYTGLRQLPKGLLLFGPPGTGKTLIGKAIAHEVNATFFSISASSLTSKWIGEGEKTVRALFGVAAVKQPSVVFIDEVDSLLSQRSSDENEASRRIKTEFLVQLDGAATASSEQVLVIGATNRPSELDEAARRRFIKRLYIPLPCAETRRQLLSKLLSKNANDITEEQRDRLCDQTDGYSGADITNLARDASMGPLRDKMRNGAGGETLRPITFQDFQIALRSIRASVSQDDLRAYVKWNDEFGTQEYTAPA